MGLSDEVLAGSQRALARLATYVENDDEIGRAGLARLYPSTGCAHIVGVTGPPGAGKSTLVNGLIGEIRRSGRRVGVIAIDPTSPLSGGAALGDRIRMLERYADDGVFIRSMASRGRRGGLAPATAGLVHILDAAGYEVIFVETVGVGQEDIDVARYVQTLLLVQVPGSGDGVQLLKAGVLECADLFVVNKADRPGANDLIRELRAMVGFADRGRSRPWRPPILRTVATSAEGVVEVVAALDHHARFLRQTGALRDRARAMASAEIGAYVDATIARRLSNPVAGADAALVDEVATRRRTPCDAADELLRGWSNQ